MDTRVLLNSRGGEAKNAYPASAPARERSVTPGLHDARDGWRVGAPRRVAPGGQRPMLRPSAVPADLAVGDAHSPFEQEASRTAGQVMREPRVAAPPATAALGAPTGASDQRAPGIVHEVLRSPGKPLDSGVRAFFEPRFDHDLSQVRVHTDNRAAESADAVGARAYTVGSHVVFGASEYSPSTGNGRNLIGHELGHVTQQQGDGAGKSNAAARPALMREPKPDEKKKGSADQATDRVPTATSPSDGATKALDAAKKMAGQDDPAIWFDSWGNDLRDNNLNGSIDEGAEQGISDGAHYGPTFNARVCKSPSDKTDVCPASDQSPIKVQYKVCIDVPIESYKAAKANVSSSRWIPTFFSEMKTKPNWTVWKKPAAPSAFLDGDIVAADNAQHGHAGIVDTGLVDWVINLPGPTASRKFGLFKPSGKNDMVSVPRVLFESFLSIDWVARLNK